MKSVQSTGQYSPLEMMGSKICTNLELGSKNGIMLSDGRNMLKGMT